MSRRAPTAFSMLGVRQWKWDPGRSSASWWHPTESLGAGFHAKFWKISFQQSFYPQKKEKPEMHLTRSLLLLLIWEALNCSGQIWIYHPDSRWKMVFKSLIHHHGEMGIYSEEVLTPLALQNLQSDTLVGTQFINDACGERASLFRFSYWPCSSSSKSLRWVDVFWIPSDNVSICVLFLPILDI